MVHGVPMRSALDDDGCEIVLRFFAMLLKVKDLNRTNSKINIGAALNVWNMREFGSNRPTFSKSNALSAHRQTYENFGYRREWLRENPDKTAADAAQAWGTTIGAARAWIFHERIRRKMVAS